MVEARRRDLRARFCSLLIAALTLLTVGAPADAQWAWGLWERDTRFIDGWRTEWHHVSKAFGDERECEAAAVREANLQRYRFWQYRTEVTGPTLVVLPEFETWVLSYECFIEPANTRQPERHVDRAGRLVG